MKVETLSRGADVEKLGEILVGITLDDEAENQEQSEVEQQLSHLTLDGTNDDVDVEVANLSKSFCNVFVLDGRPKKKAAPERKKEDEDEKSAEAEVLRKRGPQKGSRVPIHKSRPYNFPVTSISQCQRTASKLFHAGGDVITPTVSGETTQWVISQVVDPLIPDFAQILPDSLLPSENFINKDVDMLRKDFVPDDLSGQDGDDGLDEILKEYFDQLQDDLPILDPHFLRNLDPENDSTSDIGNVDTLDDGTEDRFTPVSTDAGYWSASPSSGCGILGSPLSVSSSPPLSSPPPQTIAGPRRAKRNKYLEGLDERKCEKCHRAILKKANDKDNNGLNQKDENNRTLLHVAIEKSEEVYATVLMNLLQNSFRNGMGMPSSVKDLPSYLNQTDNFGRTPLLLACVYKMPRIVEYLLECGASPALGRQFENGTVLHYLCQRGDSFLKEVSILCDKANECLHTPDSPDMVTPLHVAVACHGNPHNDAITKKTTLVNNTAIIGLLLDNGAKLSMQDCKGCTPLHLMIIKKNFELLEILYSKACDWKEAINLRNKNGRTVLHFVAKYFDMDPDKQRDLIQNLLVRDADPRIRDIEGKCPIDLVPEDRRQHLQILRYYYEDMGWKTVT